MGQTRARADELCDDDVMQKADEARVDAPTNGGDRALTAYYGGSRPVVPVKPASRQRWWLPETPGQSAKRCLPLLVANQRGWVLECPVAFSVVWDGGNSDDALTFEYDSDDRRLLRPKSLF